jgi:hypothetical protein
LLAIFRVLCAKRGKLTGGALDSSGILDAGGAFAAF